MQQLHERVAVVTGAASGIGRALAERFAREGMRLVLADLEREPLAAAAGALRARGAEIEALETDVTRADQLERLADRAFERFGAVHLLCNNAGVSGVLGRSWELAPVDWDWVLAANLRSVIDGIRLFVPRMLAQQSEGHIVNTASMAGLTCVPGSAAYTVSKHGVVALSELLHHELRAAGARLHVSVLCPSFVRTQILESERRRPAHLREPSAAAAALDPALRALLRARFETEGIEPEAVAELVVDGIRRQRFWLLTHPQAKPRIERRARTLLEDRVPELDPPAGDG